MHGYFYVPSIRLRLGVVIMAKQFYTHTQASAATTWVISHGLGYTPNVEVFVSNNGVIETILPTEVKIVDANTVHVVFSVAQTGSARLS